MEMQMGLPRWTVATGGKMAMNEIDDVRHGAGDGDIAEKGRALTTKKSSLRGQQSTCFKGDCEQRLIRGLFPLQMGHHLKWKLRFYAGY